MKKFYGNHLGIVIDNNDPEQRGRVQVFVPHILPTLYENWNKNPDNNNIQITCAGSGMPGALTDEIVNRLRQILPWADVASPIIGQSSPGNVSGGITKAIKDYVSGASDAVKKTFDKITGSTGNPEPIKINQSPTANPSGSWEPGIKLKIPNITGTDTNGLMPGFIARLNSFYEEASLKGYKVSITSGFRSGSEGNHSKGLAADLDIQGNGVHITPKSLSTAQAAGFATQGAYDTARNVDTPEFRDLLKKHALHQPLHQIYRASNPEKWHIEPIEIPVAGGRTGEALSAAVTSLRSKLGAPVPSVAEHTSSSQYPPKETPHASPHGGTPQASSGPSSPGVSNAKLKDSTIPTSAGELASPVVATKPLQEQVSLKTPTATADQIKPKSDAGSSTGDNGQALLAKMRTQRFGAEAKQKNILDRIEYIVGKKEAGFNIKHASLVFETIVNRAYFKGQTLYDALFRDVYLATVASGDTTTVREHTNFAKRLVNDVIFNGQNNTGMMTDNASNIPKNPVARNQIGNGTLVTGSFWREGKQITDPIETAHQAQSILGDEERAEFLYRKDISGHPTKWKQDQADSGRRSATYGEKARNFALAYNAGNPAPVFDAFKDLSEDIQKALHDKALANGEALTKIPSSKSTPPTVVNTIDEHGPTIHKNTNDMPKGIFTFPGVGSMVWVFFREGNPLFPVYFAASYSADEWKAAYRGNSINSIGTNIGNIGNQIASTTNIAPNAGGGLEFTHIIDNNDPSGVNNKAVAMMYGDDGSNMTFTRGYHQIYTRHDRRDQVDGQRFSIVGGNEEKWVEQDSSTNIRGNTFVKIGKIDAETINAIEELAAFSREINDELTADPEEQQV